ncbi:MAG: HEPN domain-containing protein [Gemmataceae bacterium]
MDFREYLNLAKTLINGMTEGEWRTAVSRAYYAAFHVARELLVDLKFRVPHAERAHGYLWLRLANAGHIDVQEAGNRLNALRRERNRSDYDAHLTVHQATARTHLQRAEEVIRALDAAAVEPIRTRITDAMKIYERDVLKDVTWHP